MARTFGICVAAILIVLVMAPARMILAASRNASSGACRSWVHATSPNAGTGDNNLYGVTAISAANAWAVGEYFVGVNTRTLIEHWNGNSWKVVPSPNKGATNSLYAVYAVSATNVWAAGSYYNGTAGRTLIEHWNGKAWKVVPSPNVGALTNEIFSVRGTSGRDIWAAGDAFTGYPTSRTLILHWNGRRWRLASSPSVRSEPNLLSAVRPLSPTDAWAVGRYIRGSVSKTLILHWSRRHWRIVASLNAGTMANALRGVLAFSATSAWAVGDYNNNGTIDKTLILYWNGRHWRRSFSPNAGTGSNDLNAIGGTSPANLYAVGNHDNGTVDKALILHWDGRHWRIVPGQNPGTVSNDLTAVFAFSATSIWAVGSYNSGGFNQTLVEHCR